MIGSSSWVDIEMGSIMVSGKRAPIVHTLVVDKDAYRWENDCWRFKNENLRCFGNTLGAICASGYLGEVSALKAVEIFTRTNSHGSPNPPT